MTALNAYFTAAEHPYWRWQDDGNVVAWSDGATIVFRPELLAVYRRLQTQSLPPFGAVVLLMAACRESWNQPTSRIGLLSGLLATGKRLDRLELLTRVCTRLDTVAGLDAALRTTPEAKAELAATVFEGHGPAAAPGAYESVLAELEHGLSETTLQSRRPQVAVDRLLRDLAWLDKGLERVDATALSLRLRTGLEQSLVEPGAVELAPTGAARRLLTVLQDDDELSGLARLARMLLAAVQMPVPLSIPQELPLGGVSDISNRGSLDRLLLSELANDGLTLAVRVAMNEALYFRRETLPQPPARRRVVLLDSGLRMWGVPRVFAASVGLALVAGATAGTDVAVYRAAGFDLHEVDLTSVEGLNAHLAALDHRAHPGDSLSTLANEVERAPDATDVVVVTGDDVYADREFQRRLSDAPFAELHVATVGRDGAFRLHLHSRRGRKVLRQAQFALEDVLRPPTKPTVSLLAADKSPLPAIFQTQPFPLRLSHPVELERSWYVDDFGALTYARDGRLLHWADAKHGARQLADNFPPGNLHWASCRVRHGLVYAVVGKLSRRGLRLLHIPIDGGECTAIPLEITLEQPKYLFVHQGILFVGDAIRLNACSLSTGKHWNSRLLGEYRHAGGRFFSLLRRPSFTRKWNAASFNGTEIIFTEFHSELEKQDRLLAVLETADHEGPIGIRHSGSLYDFSKNQLRAVRELGEHDELFVKEISRDGRLIALAKKAVPNVELVLNIKTLVVTPIGAYGALRLERQLSDTAYPVVLRSRFTAIGVDAEGRLTLVGRRDSLWPLTYDKTNSTLRLPSQPVAATLGLRYAFEPLATGDEIRYGLTVARFADGSRAVLDSRGLLHLKSSDPDLPEFTIVLTEGATAGWASTGETWGPDYFHLGESSSVDRRIQIHLLAPFLQRLS